MKLVLKVHDERHDELEAHIDLVGGHTHRWHVELYSEKGKRGAFTIDIPPGVTEELAISERLQADGIHARN